jgi:aminomethyltransferase
MVTNDVAALPLLGSCYAAALTPKGSMVSDVRILNRGEDLVLDCEPGQGAELRAFLGRYLISEEAEIVDAPELAIIGLVGPASGARAQALRGAYGGSALCSLFGGTDLLCSRSQLGAIEVDLAATPKVSPSTFEVLRVERGVARWGVDLTANTIPLEANLEHAIHFQKGCYIGQEVIARATARGQMNKKLMGLELGLLEPPVGTELRFDDKKVGWLTSVVHSLARGQVIALGYVQRDHLTVGKELILSTGGVARVARLPF